MGQRASAVSGDDFRVVHPAASMDRYVMVERIGEGTFGEVHRAKDTTTGHMVALKRIRLRTMDEGGACAASS